MKLEEKILEFMVNIPLETERLRDFFGLEGNNLMMIVAKVRDLIRMQKPSKSIPNAREIHAWPAQSIQRCSVSRPMGWKGATTLFPKTRNSLFLLWAPGRAPSIRGFDQC